MDFLIMIVAAVIVFGKLAAKSEGEGNKKRTQNVGPTAEEWAERLRQSAAGGEVSDKLNSAVSQCPQKESASPERPRYRSGAGAPQRRRTPSQREALGGGPPSAGRLPARPRRRRRQLRGPSREPEGPLRRRHPRPRGVHPACRARQGAAFTPLNGEPI